MFLREPVNHIHWSGESSLKIIKELLEDQLDTVIELPINMHHALYSHLNPDAPPGPVEHVEASGSADLLDKIAEVAGLEHFATLSQTVKQKQARVSVLSPPSRILFEFRSHSN